MAKSVGKKARLRSSAGLVLSRVRVAAAVQIPCYPIVPAAVRHKGRSQAEPCGVAPRIYQPRPQAAPLSDTSCSNSMIPPLILFGTSYDGRVISRSSSLIELFASQYPALSAASRRLEFSRVAVCAICAALSYPTFGARAVTSIQRISLRTIHFRSIDFDAVQHVFDISALTGVIDQRDGVQEVVRNYKYDGL